MTRDMDETANKSCVPCYVSRLVQSLDTFWTALQRLRCGCMRSEEAEASLR
jgi:hypothetical protein